jgi:flavin-dependent dehydrogenase
MPHMSRVEKKPRILVAGGGPAGSSLAIRLARQGHSVTLIERERFPRHKLCGEFISPECIDHLEELGVRDLMLASGGATIAETVFYERGGRGVAVPSEWLGRKGAALSLSRARMDEVLLREAEKRGVEVIEGANLKGIETNHETVSAIKFRTAHGEAELAADIFVDATGRHRVLARLAEKRSGKGQGSRSEKLVGFKVHLEHAAVHADRCEIYSFPGGYAGLSPIENGLANLCMIVKASMVAELKYDRGRLIADLVTRNRRALATLASAVPVSEWLAVAVDRFGAKAIRPAKNLFAVGDSAAFIDPFTGSGMLMALEGSKALATAFAASDDVDVIDGEYARSADKLFTSRLRISSVLRRVAYSPTLATATVHLLGVNSMLRRGLARSTRGGTDARARP